MALSPHDPLRLFSLLEDARPPTDKGELGEISVPAEGRTGDQSTATLLARDPEGRLVYECAIDVQIGRLASIHGTFEFERWRTDDLEGDVVPVETLEGLEWCGLPLKFDLDALRQREEECRSQLKAALQQHAKSDTLPAELRDTTAAQDLRNAAAAPASRDARMRKDRATSELIEWMSHQAREYDKRQDALTVLAKFGIDPHGLRQREEECRRQLKAVLQQHAESDTLPAEVRDTTAAQELQNAAAVPASEATQIRIDGATSKLVDRLTYLVQQPDARTVLVELGLGDLIPVSRLARLGAQKRDWLENLKDAIGTAAEEGRLPRVLASQEGADLIGPAIRRARALADTRDDGGPEIDVAEEGQVQELANKVGRLSSKLARSVIRTAAADRERGASVLFSLGLPSDDAALTEIAALANPRWVALTALWPPFRCHWSHVALLRAPARDAEKVRSQLKRLNDVAASPRFADAPHELWRYIADVHPDPVERFGPKAKALSYRFGGGPSTLRTGFLPSQLYPRSTVTPTFDVTSAGHPDETANLRARLDRDDHNRALFIAGILPTRLHGARTDGWSPHSEVRSAADEIVEDMQSEIRELAKIGVQVHHRGTRKPVEGVIGYDPDQLPSSAGGGVTNAERVEPIEGNHPRDKREWHEVPESLLRGSARSSAIIAMAGPPHFDPKKHPGKRVAEQASSILKNQMVALIESANSESTRLAGCLLNAMKVLDEALNDGQPDWNDGRPLDSDVRTHVLHRLGLGNEARRSEVAHGLGWLILQDLEFWPTLQEETALVNEYLELIQLVRDQRLSLRVHRWQIAGLRRITDEHRRVTRGLWEAVQDPPLEGDG